MSTSIIIKGAPWTELDSDHEALKDLSLRFVYRPYHTTHLQVKLNALYVASYCTVLEPYRDLIKLSIYIARGEGEGDLCGILYTGTYFALRPDRVQHESRIDLIQSIPPTHSLTEPITTRPLELVLRLESRAASSCYSMYDSLPLLCHAVSRNLQSSIINHWS